MLGNGRVASSAAICGTAATASRLLLRSEIGPDSSRRAIGGGGRSPTLQPASETLAMTAGMLMTSTRCPLATGGGTGALTAASTAEAGRARAIGVVAGLQAS